VEARRRSSTSCSDSGVGLLYQRQTQGRRRRPRTADRTITNWPGVCCWSTARHLGRRVSDPAQRFAERLRGWFKLDDTFTARDAARRESGCPRSSTIGYENYWTRDRWTWWKRPVDGHRPDGSGVALGAIPNPPRRSWRATVVSLKDLQTCAQALTSWQRGRYACKPGFAHKCVQIGICSRNSSPRTAYGLYAYLTGTAKERN